MIKRRGTNSASIDHLSTLVTSALPQIFLVGALFGVEMNNLIKIESSKPVEKGFFDGEFQLGAKLVNEKGGS